jgi:hypothetical protein
MSVDEDEPTVDWSVPSELSAEEYWEARFSEQDTDPIGFAPIEYPPPADPFDDEEELPVTGNGFDPALPGWSTPPSKPRRRHRFRLIGVAVLAVAGLIAAILLAPRLVGPGRTAPAAMAVPAGANSVSGPVDGATAASFELADGVASVRLRAAELGGDLYRIAAAGVTPRVDRTGSAIRLRLPGSPTGVEILLNAAVRWTLRLEAGAADKRLDLSGASVSAVVLGGGASRIDLTLPAPRGLLTVRMSGGVDQFLVRLARATPVRVTLSSGAGEVTLAGATHHGIAPGGSFQAYGWGAGDTGVDLLAAAGLTALTVTVP